MKLTAAFPFMHLFMESTVYSIPGSEMHFLAGFYCDGWWMLRTNKCLSVCTGATATSKNIHMLTFFRLTALNSASPFLHVLLLFK